MATSRKEDAVRGETIPVQGEKQEPSLRQPHERDESAHSQAQAEPSQQAMGELAKDSVDQGQTDTDRGPVLDATYKKEFRR
jgi:hypothetical protein